MKKKILLVSDFYEPHKSGIVTYIIQIINVLKSQNFEISILTTKYKNNLKEIENINGINVIRCRPTLKISRGYYSIDLVLKFLKIYKNYDIINIHLPLTEIFPIAFLVSKKKTIVNYHCLPEFPFYLKFLKFYFYIFGILSVLKSSKNIVLSKDYFDNIIFHNYLNNNTFEVSPYILPPKVKSKKTINDNFKIGYLGRLSNEKGIEYLIDASKKLSINNFKHELIIAGDDQDIRFYKYIKYLKKRSKFSSNIKFIGRIEDKDIQNFFENINIFVLPSTNSFEAFGIVQLEAMSYGVPVIASNLYGVRTIIKKTKNGHLFNNKNSEDLYSKIFEYKNNPLNSDEVIQNVQKHYNKQIFKKKLLKLLS